jgi:hypothetical protein
LLFIENDTERNRIPESQTFKLGIYKSHGIGIGKPKSELYTNFFAFIAILNRNTTLFPYFQILLLKRAVTKFKSQISDANSSTNDTVHSYSNTSGGQLRERLLSKIAGGGTNRVASATTNNNSVVRPVVGAILKDSGGESGAAAVATAANSATSAKPENHMRSGSGSKWNLMRRQSSRQMLSTIPSVSSELALNAEGGGGNDDNAPADPGAAYVVKKKPSWAPTTAFASLSSTTRGGSATVASSMMHDFNLSMCEYRGEMNENMGALNDKINRLEGVIVDLAEKMPDLLREMNRVMGKRYASAGGGGGASGGGGDGKGADVGVQSAAS